MGHAEPEFTQISSVDFAPLFVYRSETYSMSQTLHAAFRAATERNKLLQLREKTDRQIFQFIRSRLDTGLKLTAQVEYERAAEILIEAEKLLPVLNEPQQRSLQPKLNELRLILERPCATMGAAG